MHGFLFYSPGLPTGYSAADDVARRVRAPGDGRNRAEWAEKASGGSLGCTYGVSMIVCLANCWLKFVWLLPPFWQNWQPKFVKSMFATCIEFVKFPLVEKMLSICYTNVEAGARESCWSRKKEIAKWVVLTYNREQALQKLLPGPCTSQLPASVVWC